MPYEITYLEDNTGVITTYSGVVTDDDFIKCVAERLSSNEVIKNYRYLVSDYSNVAQFKITPQGVKVSAEMAIAASKINNNILLIVVMPTDLEFGMARMWQAYADDNSTGWTTAVVRTMPEALEKLKDYKTNV